MAKTNNDYLPNGDMAPAAAQRTLRGVPGAKLMLSAGEYYVVPGGRLAASKAREIIKKLLTIDSVGLFTGCAQSWVHPRNKEAVGYKAVAGYLRAMGAQIARRLEEAERERRPYSVVDDQRHAINSVLARHNVARIADSEAPADTLVRMYQQTSPRDEDHRRLIAACMKWVIGPMGRRSKTPKENQHGNASENENATTTGDANGE